MSYYLNQKIVSIARDMTSYETREKSACVEIGAKLAISVSARAQGYKHPFAVET